MTLRPYQRKAIDQLYTWASENKGNPCLVLPTGAGKSHVIAQICKEAGNAKIIMLTSKKELIEQNLEKLLLHYPEADCGIVSASIGKKQFNHKIIFAGVMSIKNHISKLGKVDLVIVDEADEINHKDEGTYRNFISALMPDRVIGLTATPFRCGHGLITDDPAIFDTLIEPVSIVELQQQGFLAKMVSKHPKKILSTDGVHKRGGEYIESELQKAVDIQEVNIAVVSEVLERAGDRRSWLFFCTGIDHSLHIRDILRENGISAETVTSKTPKKEREQIFLDFKDGKIKALTGANVFSVGFDAPNVDLIAFLRPTMSARVYIQQAGRGLRLKDHTDHCMVLDFAGNISVHGAITDVRIPGRKSDEPGIPPSKLCPDCESIIPAQSRKCPDCGHVFDIQAQRKEWKLHHDDIMGLAPKELEVGKWRWLKHISKKTKKEMLRVSYYGKALSDKPIDEYLAITHTGYAGEKAMSTLRIIAKEAGVDIMQHKTIEDLATALTAGYKPDYVKYKKDGKYDRVIERVWEEIPF